MQEFLVGREIAGRDRLADIREIMADRRRIEADIGLEIELLEMRIGAEIVDRIAVLAQRVLEEQRCRRPADECRRFLQHARPALGLQRGVVNPADQIGKRLDLLHSHAPVGPLRRCPPPTAREGANLCGVAPEVYTFL